jgi:hypothetical protein
MKSLGYTFIVTFLIASGAQAQSTAPTGTLHVVARDETGLPLPGARVAYHRVVALTGVGRQAVPAPGEAVVHSVASADANGASALPGLPAGNYVLCGWVPSRPYLDPCKWGVMPQMKISPNAVSSTTLVLRKGALLKVRINDPQRLIPQTKDGPLGGPFIVGVKFGRGAFIGAENTGLDPAGRDYQMAIPVGQQLYLWIFSHRFSLTDAANKAVDVSGVPAAFQASATADQVFTFTVSGFQAKPN